jgi:hypothetical protein
MKNIMFKISIAICILAFSIGCSADDLADLNVNKNAVTEMDPSYVLSTSILAIGGEYENTRTNMLYSATMIQHTASLAGYFSGDKYYYSAQYSGAYMERHFTAVMRGLSNVIEQTKEDPALANVNAVATIMRAFDLHRMTDLHGDIPYTQAGYGLQDEANWFPTYESQKDVYSNIVSDVKAARDKLSSSAKALGAQDVVYGGDIAKWKKFANALLMRVAMRMSNVDPNNAKAVFTEAYNSGAFTSNDDNGTIKYLSGPQGFNRNGLNDGYWNTYKYSKDAKISKTFIDWMKANNDPRLMIVSGGTGNPEDPTTWNTDPAAQIGMPNGYTTATLQTSGLLTADQLATFTTPGVGNRMFSMINIKYIDWEDPYWLISFAETELMTAEAMVKGWISGDASAKFASGVTAAITAWTAFDASFNRTAAEISAYILGRGFASANDSTKLQLIGEEYWAATWLNDIESWSNWRRTGFPSLTPTSDPNRYNGINIIPRRLKYWENEISSNPANYEAAVNRMGGDEMDVKVWWDGGN